MCLGDNPCYHLDCGHLVLCSECYEIENIRNEILNRKECPECRKQTTQLTRVFI